jgi:uncharacterized membrane protein
MTKFVFMTTLRQGLAGLPASAQADIVADYEAHFADGEAAGRTEAEVAAALGDPARLARELSAEFGMKRWEATRTPSTAASAIFALLGLGAIDILFLLPIMVGIAGALFGLLAAVIVIFVAGVVVFVAGPFTGPPGGPGTAILLGVGLMTGAVSLGALVAAAGICCMNATVWYARLHYQLLKPALQPNAFVGGLV